MDTSILIPTGIFHTILTYIILIVCLIIAAVFSGGVQAFIVHNLGDPSPKLNGRLNFQRSSHVDIVGVIFGLISGGYSWPKNLESNPQNFRNPIFDQLIAALSGPIAHIILAIAISPLLKFIRLENLTNNPNILLTYTEIFLSYLFTINITMAIFNLLPLHNLPGSKIVGLILPPRDRQKFFNFLENWYFYFLAFILFDVFVIYDVADWSIFGFIVGTTSDWLYSIILFGT